MRLTDQQLTDLETWAARIAETDNAWDPDTDGIVSPRVQCAAVQTLIAEARERRAADLTQSTVPEWDDVCEARNGPWTRRLRVPGGWLYQICTGETWHPPVFVPELMEFHHPDGRVTP